MSEAIGELGECCGCGRCRWAKVEAYRVVPGVGPVHTWARTETPIVFGTGGVWDEETMQMMTVWFLDGRWTASIGGSGPGFTHPTAMDSLLNHGDPTQQKRYRKATWTCTGTGSGSGWSRTYDSGRVVEWNEDTGLVEYVRDWCNDSVTADGVTTTSDYERVWTRYVGIIGSGSESGTHHGAERPDPRGIPSLKDYLEAWEPDGYARATYTASESQITIHYEQAFPLSGLGDFDVTYNILLETPKTCDQARVEAETMLALVDFAQFGSEAYHWPYIEVLGAYQWEATEPMQWMQKATLYYSAVAPSEILWEHVRPLAQDWLLTPPIDSEDAGRRERVPLPFGNTQDDHPNLECFWDIETGNSIAPSTNVLVSKILIDPNDNLAGFGVCYVANEEGAIDTWDTQFESLNYFPGLTGTRSCVDVLAEPSATNVTPHTIDGRTVYEVRWNPAVYPWGIGEIFWGCSNPSRYPSIPACCHDEEPPTPFNADATTITADSTTRTADELGL